MAYAPVNAGQLLFGPLTQFLQQYNAEQRARTEREGVRAEDLAWNTAQAGEQRRRWEEEQRQQALASGFGAVRGVEALPGARAAGVAPMAQQFLRQLGRGAQDMAPVNWAEQLTARGESEATVAERSRRLKGGEIAGRQLVGTPGYRQKGLDLLLTGVPDTIDESAEQRRLDADSAAKTLRARNTGRRGGGAKAAPAIPLNKYEFALLLGDLKLSKRLYRQTFNVADVGQMPDSEITESQIQHIDGLASAARDKASQRVQTAQSRFAEQQLKVAEAAQKALPNWMRDTPESLRAAEEVGRRTREYLSAIAAAPVVGAPYAPSAEDAAPPAAPPPTAAPALAPKAAPKTAPKATAAPVAPTQQLAKMKAMPGATLLQRLPALPDFVLPDGTTKQQLMDMTPQQNEAKVRSQR